MQAPYIPNMRVFIEQQQFNQWWFRGVMLFILATIVFALIMALPEVDSTEPAFWVLIVSCAISLVMIVVIMVFMKLDTKIDEQGVHYAFRPFHRSLRHISWHDMAECYVRKYSPIGEFGGWGYRFSFGSGKALNVKGNVGIQIVFTNGKRLLIGTQKSEDAMQVLTTYSHKLRS